MHGKGEGDYCFECVGRAVGDDNSYYPVFTRGGTMMQQAVRLSGAAQTLGLGKRLPDMKMHDNGEPDWSFHDDGDYRTFSTRAACIGRLAFNELINGGKYVGLSANWVD